MGTPLIGDLLRDAAAADPEREAYVHGEKRVTYAWLDRVADGFAATLLDSGVERGDVVALLVPSSIKFAACYLGALRVGAVTSAVNLRLGPAEQASVLARTEPRVTVLGDQAELPVSVDAGRVLPVSGLKDAFDADPPTRWPRLTPSDPTCVVWTSGTTGAPKGAVYDHETQAAISRNVGELTAPGDRRLVVLPFAHVGYMTRIWDELTNATTIVLVGEPWSAAETIRILREERITMATGVPTQWSRVLDDPGLATTDCSGLRVAAIGGASIPPELVRRIRETLGCPVITRYTSTEAGVTTSTLASDSDEVIATTVGRPTPEVSLRVVTPATGEPVADAAVGEVICRSPAMMRGYWRDPALTASVIDDDGWLHTGDLGFVGADGNLRLVGRLKEMYIRGGYNVYPREIEEVFYTHPAVLEAAVVGVAHDALGEEVGAAIVLKSGEHTTPEELREFVRAKVAAYKYPRVIWFTDALPKGPTGKILKREIDPPHPSG